MERPGSAEFDELPKFPFRVYDRDQQYKTLAIDRKTNVANICKMAADKWLPPARGGSQIQLVLYLTILENGEIMEKRQLQNSERPGEIMQLYRGNGRLLFSFMTREGKPLPEGWVPARTKDRSSILVDSSEAGTTPFLMGGTSVRALQAPATAPSYTAPGSPASPAASPRQPHTSPSPKNSPLAVGAADKQLIGLRERMNHRMTTLMNKEEIQELRSQLTALQEQEKLARKRAEEAEAKASSSPAGGPPRKDDKNHMDIEDFDINQKCTIDTSDLNFGKVIGEGQYGMVYKGTYFSTPVAIKELLEVEGETLEQTMKYVKREIAALLELRHPNIVQFMGYGLKETKIYLITEFIDGGDLHLLLKTTSIELPWPLRIAMTTDIARAMCFLHALNWVHRDLKTENLLVDRNGKLKICDLGLARKFGRARRELPTGRYTICGTNEFMSPEMILGLPYDKATDVFSFGVILGEIITRKEPHERDSDLAYKVDWEQFMKGIPDDCPVQLFQLMKQCCAFDVTSRPSFNDILAEITKMMEIYAA